MSNPKHDWYGHAVKQVKKYPDKLIAENTAQSAELIDTLWNVNKISIVLPFGIPPN